MWPERRSDGSVDVGVQFVPKQPAAKAQLEAAVAAYIERKAWAGVDLLEDLATFRRLRTPLTNA
jgi:hypothetical protein